MSLVKSAPKKFFAKKIGFLGKTFFRYTFYKGHMYISEISMKDRFFDTTFDLIKEKSFRLIVRSMCTFSELKSPKMQATTQYGISENGIFWKKVVEFRRTSECFMPDIQESKSLVPNEH
jgi:hypothetical protein